MSKLIHDKTPRNPFAAGRTPLPPGERMVYTGRCREKYAQLAEALAKEGGFRNLQQFLESAIYFAKKNLADVRKNSVDE